MIAGSLARVEPVNNDQLLCVRKMHARYLANDFAAALDALSQAVISKAVVA